MDYKRFLLRRAFKIYPAFYALILITALRKYLFNEGLSRKALAGELLFIQNYTGGLWHHTWSLAVEEHFYIALIVVFYGLIKFSKNSGTLKDPFRAFPTCFLLTAILCQSLRILNLLTHEEYSHGTFLFGTHIRIDSLMYGSLLAYLWYFRNLKSSIKHIPSQLLLAVGIISLSPAFIYPLEEYPLMSVIGVVGLYFGSGCILLAAIRLAFSGNPILRLMGYLGSASYSIYLWHLAVGKWGWSLAVQLGLPNRYSLYVPFYLFGSIAFGCILNKILETPILLLRDRMIPSAKPIQTSTL